MTIKSETNLVAGSNDSRTADKFVVRLPDGLREHISVTAKANHRSMNNEIVARIDGSLDLERKYEEMRQLNALLNLQIATLDRLQPHLEAARNAKDEWSAASVAHLESDRKDRAAHETTVAHAEKTQAAFMHAAHVLTAELLKQTELAQ